jgi:cbb3-type cytochrome oxidase cytochrome c subunit
MEGEPKVGPNLAAIESRRPPNWMESHFRTSASDAEAKTRPTLSAAQMNALVSFMSKLTPDKAADLEGAPASLLDGADVFVSNLCTSCHKVNGEGGQTGPSLNGVAGRRSRQWMEKHFEAPRVMSPGSIMPPYHFPPNEQDQLISYLFQLQ